MAAYGSDLWFIADRPGTATSDHLWLTKTTQLGKPLLAPTPVDTAGGSYLGRATLTISDVSVVVGFLKISAGLDQPYVRAFDHDGVPFEAADRGVPLMSDAEGFYSSSGLALASSADGRVRLLTALLSATGPEVAVVELDEIGQSTGSRAFAGTNDDGQNVALAAAVQADGSMLIAWDRAYENCFGPARDAQTLTATIDAGYSVGALGTVRDLPERSEVMPVIASRDASTFVAWQTGWQSNVVALARYPDVDAPLEIEAAYSPLLALADGNRGAIAWTTADDLMHVATFHLLGAAIVLGEPRTFGTVSAPMAAYAYAVGLAHVGDSRYVLAWQEQDVDVREASRLFATTIDFDEPARSRPYEPVATDLPPTRFRSKPCSH